MLKNLFQTQCPACFLLLLLGLATIALSCNNSSYHSPQGYNLRRPARAELGKVLNEISGLNYNSDDQSLLAISDNKDKIFRMDLRQQKLTDLVENFYKQEDFEDLVKLDSSIFVLISNGTLVEVPLNKADTVRTYPAELQGFNDLESLYYDSAANGLIMLCKTCASDKNDQVRTAYRFDLAQKQFDPQPYYTISSDSVKQSLKSEDANFKPSAAAINPIDKRLYILASAGQILVVTDRKGKVMEAYYLNPDDHPQAEGLAFSPSGTMYISNEGKYGKATLQVYPYQQKKSKPRTKASKK